LQAKAFTENSLRSKKVVYEVKKEKMNKTKSRLSAIVVLTSVLVLGVLALSTGIASEDSSPLND
jgi:hypothetical protein